MKPPVYPFSAIVGQEEMKLALLLAAVDWRIGVLLRGDKGAGKTTAARGLATLLPHPSPFINLPIGATEDRLLGGLHLERALKGEPALKPGLLSEAHGGVLYVDEINLLPGHLGDTLLDAASSGVNTVEREGFSASHAAEFVLLGSMNPEEGSLRPQLLDRFALAVDIAVPVDPVARQTVIERRIAFEQDPTSFNKEWTQPEQQLCDRLNAARTRRPDILYSKDLLASISESVCEAGVRSLRADLAIVRAAIAYAALVGDASVLPNHVSTVLPLALAHRSHERGRPPAPRTQPPAPKSRDSQIEPPDPNGLPNARDDVARIFAPREVETFAIRAAFESVVVRGISAMASVSQPGPVVGSRRTETPVELDVRATLNHTVRETGAVHLRTSDLHERIRAPRAGTRYLFVVDSSGSHAVQERMRLVKGVANSLLTRSFKIGDEVGIIAFRGTEAQVLLEPSNVLQEATATLEYLPTGGRTPLAHALHLAQKYLTPTTVIILLTDGRANVPLENSDAWQDAIDMAGQIKSSVLVIDTENSSERLGRSRMLAEALSAEYFHLESAELNETLVLALQRVHERGPSEC
ncbi:VWA domain-containing protein [Granulicella sp. 5B5]|uniref:ATP-binding protein n=1 Tax=Granulicella sp. 5B5 TaxID=1617967 RepID=UPI0015F40834|nr:ATP-binding protein [Granulicella sp. 5B5]QMV17324.1 VWA domain-containing protein [Granulicella sp. 5B5]